MQIKHHTDPKRNTAKIRSVISHLHIALVGTAMHTFANMWLPFVGAFHNHPAPLAARTGAWDYPVLIEAIQNRLVPAE